MYLPFRFYAIDVPFDNGIQILMHFLHYFGLLFPFIHVIFKIFAFLLEIFYLISIFHDYGFKFYTG